MPIFSFRGFMVSDLTFKVVNYHLKLIFVNNDKQWSRFILLQVAVQFHKHYLLRRLSISHSLLFCHKSIVFICVDLFIGSQLFSTDLCVCFSVNTMVFWLLFLGSIIWNQGMGYPQLCSFLSEFQNYFDYLGLL